MENSGPDLAPVVRMRATHVSAAGSRGMTDELVGVAVESTIAIDVGGKMHFLLMCTPSEQRNLAAGFLLSEGIIENLDDISTIRPCAYDSSTIRVALSDSASTKGKERSLIIVSSCGACGTEDIQEKLSALPLVDDTFSLDTEVLLSLERSLRGCQTLFGNCGATHAAAIFDHRGRILASAEDIGRHNALDKAIGFCLLKGIQIAGQGVMLSGRISMEMVAKCARVGIELIAAISAPTSLAVVTAEQCNITICGFVRDSRATIFVHSERIRGSLAEI